MNNDILSQIANDERRPQHQREAAKRANQESEDRLIEQALGRKIDRNDARYGTALRRLCSALSERPDTATWLTPDNELFAGMELADGDSDLVPELVTLYGRTSSERIRDAVIFTLCQFASQAHQAQTRKAASAALQSLVKIRV